MKLPGFLKTIGLSSALQCSDFRMTLNKSDLRSYHGRPELHRSEFLGRPGGWLESAKLSFSMLRALLPSPGAVQIQGVKFYLHRARAGRCSVQEAALVGALPARVWRLTAPPFSVLELPSSRRPG